MGVLAFIAGTFFWIMTRSLDRQEEEFNRLGEDDAILEDPRHPRHHDTEEKI